MSHAIPHDDMISAEEALIADVQFVIHNLMQDRSLSRADLARELGVSQARVTQMFSDSAKNLTLRTLARVFRVLGQECRVTCDRWDALLEEPRTSEEPGKKCPDHWSHASDFARMLELEDHLERVSRDAYAPLSNDNFQVNALAA